MSPSVLSNLVTSTSRPEQEALEYYQANFPELDRFILVVLSPDQQYTTPLASFSHEALYRIAYTICWQGMRRQLYDNVIGSITQILTAQYETLSSIEVPASWFKQFAKLLINHDRATSTMSSIFAYLNRTYVKSELQLDLTTELRQLLYARFVQGQSEKIFRALRMVVAGTISIQGGVIQIPGRDMADLIQCLHRISTGKLSQAHSSYYFFWYNPPLFQQCIPNFQPPTNAAELIARFDQTQARLDVESQMNGMPPTSDMSSRKHGQDPDETPTSMAKRVNQIDYNDGMDHD
ncbi:hypothetical protein SmJEL517_g05808 [Synchytrium microbalum]|uniref:Cullin N-terminal domain-containing protein n=1 Tax=Synchytrium microbalum TaxID=1806994 RepID=A0A507BY67_9FUNG|nr:uncharacterized protein SmJEL517_g05808 [Synchytrium microbalum]TPX30666.1 hypothetical protein SmJEL517_g05808 [Synchytrium microbalum]